MWMYVKLYTDMCMWMRMCTCVYHVYMRVYACLCARIYAYSSVMYTYMSLFMHVNKCTHGCE
jgi:hypothetical protein